MQLARPRIWAWHAMPCKLVSWPSIPCAKSWARHRCIDVLCDVCSSRPTSPVREGWHCGTADGHGIHQNQHGIYNKHWTITSVDDMKLCQEIVTCVHASSVQHYLFQHPWMVCSPVTIVRKKSLSKTNVLGLAVCVECCCFVWLTLDSRYKSNQNTKQWTHLFT